MNNESPPRADVPPTENDPQRDAYLHAALRHAPDRDRQPPTVVADAIRRAAHEAVAARPRSGQRTWVARVGAWLDGVLRRPSLATGLAGVLVATVVGLMWWDESLPPPTRQAPPAAPAAAPPQAAAGEQPARQPATASASSDAAARAASPPTAHGTPPAAAAPAAVTMAERPGASPRAKTSGAAAPAAREDAGVARAPAPAQAEGSAAPLAAADAPTPAAPAPDVHRSTAAAPAAPAPPAKAAARLEAPAVAAALPDAARSPMLPQAPAAAPAGAALERRRVGGAPPPLQDILRDPQAWSWRGPDDHAAQPPDASALARLRALAALPWQRYVGELPPGPRVRWLAVGSPAASAELVIGERQAVWLTPDGQRFSAEWSAEERDRWR